MSEEAKTTNAVVEHVRGEWGSKLEFFLSCLSQAVGLGNVWRFPYLVFRHSGSFLIPYILTLIIAGIPMLFMEMSLGQYSALGTLPLFKSLCPALSGIGYAIYFRQFLSCVMYNAIISWTLFYFAVSMTDVLPWSHCNNDFNTKQCFNQRTYASCKDGNSSNVFYENQCYNSSYACVNNFTEIAASGRVSPSEEYLNIFVMEKTTKMDDMGPFNWRISLCYISCWIMIFLCCIKGIKSIGKVVYFTAVFPYVVLIILLIRGVTLKGATDGLLYFITPRWDKLSDITVWQEASVQIFFSVGLASGSMVTFASYNKFNHNIIRDSALVALVNSFTSILAGLVIFAILGFMADQLHQSIDDVAAGGPGLAFIVYPEALTRMPISPFWSILFFFMLLTLGLGSQFGSIENAITCMVDELPHLRSKKIYLLLGYCVISCLIGLTICFGNGVYIIDLFFSVSSWNYLVIGFLEVIIVGYLYGIEHFFDNVQSMTNKTLGIKLKSHAFTLYTLIIPLFLIMTFMLIFICYKPFKSGDYVYPMWANAIGWTMGLIPLLIILVFTLYQIFGTRGSLSMKEHLKKLITPTELWTRNYLRNKIKDSPADSPKAGNSHETKF